MVMTSCRVKVACFPSNLESVIEFGKKFKQRSYSMHGVLFRLSLLIFCRHAGSTKYRRPVRFGSSHGCLHEADNWRYGVNPYDHENCDNKRINNKAINFTKYSQIFFLFLFKKKTQKQWRFASYNEKLRVNTGLPSACCHLDFYLFLSPSERRQKTQ